MLGLLVNSQFYSIGLYMSVFVSVPHCFDCCSFVASFYFCLLLVILPGIKDLSSPTRDLTCAPCSGSEESFFFFLISWRLITLQYCSGFCHTLTWISHGYTCIPIPDPPSHLPLHPIPRKWGILTTGALAKSHFTVKFWNLKVWVLQFCFLKISFWLFRGTCSSNFEDQLHLGRKATGILPGIMLNL